MRRSRTRRFVTRDETSLVCTCVCVCVCVCVQRNKYYSFRSGGRKAFSLVGSVRREGKGSCACPERRIASSHWSIRGFHGRESSICSPLTFVSGTEHAPMELGLSTFNHASLFLCQRQAKENYYMPSDVSFSFTYIQFITIYYNVEKLRFIVRNLAFIRMKQLNIRIYIIWMRFK